MNQKNWFLIYRAQLSRHDGTPSCFSCTTAHVKRNEFAWKAQSFSASLFSTSSLKISEHRHDGAALGFNILYYKSGIKKWWF